MLADVVWRWTLGHALRFIGRMPTTPCPVLSDDLCKSVQTPDSLPCYAPDRTTALRRLTPLNINTILIIVLLLILLGGGGFYFGR